MSPHLILCVCGIDPHYIYIPVDNKRCSLPTNSWLFPDPGTRSSAPWNRCHRWTECMAGRTTLDALSLRGPDSRLVSSELGARKTVPSTQLFPTNSMWTCIDLATQGTSITSRTPRSGWQSGAKNLALNYVYFGFVVSSNLTPESLEPIHHCFLCFGGSKVWR